MQQQAISIINIGLTTDFLQQAYSLNYRKITPNIFLFRDRSDILQTINISDNKIINQIHTKADFQLPSTINSTVDHKHKCIYVLLTNGKTAVFDYQLNLLTIVDISILKHSLDFHYMEYFDCFLIIRSNEIDLQPIQLFTNHNKKGLFKSALAFNLDLLEPKRIKSSICYPQGIKFINQTSFLIFSGDSVQIHQMKDYTKSNLGTTKFLYQNLCQLPNTITCITYLPDKRLFIMGTQYGIIKCYQISQQKEIFTIHSHTKRIQDITITQQSILITIGLDNYVNVTDIQLMKKMEAFRLENHIKHALFIDTKFNGFLALSLDNKLFNNEAKIQHKMVFHHNSIITHSLTTANNHVIAFTDNSIIMIRPNQMKRTNKQQNGTIDKKKSGEDEFLRTFIPPRCKSILCMILNPFRSNNKTSQIWLLTDYSQIYKYQIDQISRKVKVLEVLPISKFYDRFNRQNIYQITLISFIDKVPLMFDEQFKEKQYEPYGKNVKQCQPICLATSDGNVLIVSSIKIKYIIARLCLFHEELKTMTIVSSINVLKKYEIDELPSFIIAVSQHQYKIIKIANNCQPKLYLKKSAKNKCFQTVSNNCTAIYYGTDLQLLWGCDHDLWMNTTVSTKCDNSITVLSYNKENKLLIGGDQSGNIYLWNNNLKLIKKITAGSSDQVQYAALLDRYLLFGYNKKLYEMNMEIPLKLENLNFDEMQKIVSEFKQETFFFENQAAHFLDQVEIQARKKKRFQKSRKKQLSLPLIKSSFHQQEARSLSKNSGSRLFSNQRTSIISRSRNISHKKKPTNYEQMFHFPNFGLYNQLLKKRIIS